MKYYIKNEGENITVVSIAPFVGSTEVETDEDLILYIDNYNFIDGKLITS